MSEAATASPVAIGRLVETSAEGIVLAVPETDYRLHLTTAKPLEADLRDKVRGTIHAAARRVDVVPSGGRYVEPVFGRPRRVQGRILAGDPAAGTLTVHAGVPVIARLTDPRQKVGDFSIGQLVSFDVERGARFEPETA